MTLLQPTNYITKTGQQEVIDGLTYDFMMAPFRSTVGNAVVCQREEND